MSIEQVDKFLRNFPTQEVDCNVERTKADGSFVGNFSVPMPMIDREALIAEWDILKREMEN